MNFKHVLIVFKKEVKDIARDKRTLITNLVVPIILMPLLFWVVSGSIKDMEDDISDNITVALTSESDKPEIRDLLENNIFKDYKIKLNGSVKDPIEAIRNKDIRFVLDVQNNFEESLDKYEPFQIKIIYDTSDTKSSASYEVLANAINSFNSKIVAERINDLGLNIEILQPVKIVMEDAADERSANMMIMMLLPMMISILIAVGGIPVATDLVAGEKERGTFEPLLTTQAGRSSVLLGKYFTVTLFSIVSMLAQFVGIIIATYISPEFIGMGSNKVSFYIPPLALLLTMLITITLGMVFAGLQLAVSTYARSFKEAQTYLSFFIFVAMVPSYATMMMQPDDIKSYMFFIPLMNSIASIKMVLGNVINYSYLTMALCSSFIYVILSLMFSSYMFNEGECYF